MIIGTHFDHDFKFWDISYQDSLVLIIINHLLAFYGKHLPIANM